MAFLNSLAELDPARFESVRILKQLASASRSLAELKGIAATIPNQGILINTLGIQEAKDSSEIENIVTTHDDLYKGEGGQVVLMAPAVKEVLRYRQALLSGYDLVRQNRMLTVNHILQIQSELEQNMAGIRALPGTLLKDSSGHTVYTPPQNPDEIRRLMTDLERFINDNSLFAADPLIKMALIHHQFESIHPFYDGNGRTGRIINVLYLVLHGMLDIPVLYLSSYIVRNKARYYRLLQGVRDDDTWEDWVMYMLQAVELTAADTIQTIHAIRTVLQDTKHRIRSSCKFYSQDLINNLFTHPYTKIEFIEQDLKVSRITAAKYLDTLVAKGFLRKVKRGRSNYYINHALYEILTNQKLPA